ncbi:PREDICTED: putative methyl-CpG-binding domain protein 3-like 5 [Chinchilla lanigera]|uniref:putative methyl-CpG-binding domain protein 3-like 5 n=1 Tax=Chinchilla lanigera TaxID=34839 RepID=UPI00069881AD|nr:PREDICTED: putative methyl-CpG-binding domain protein 3-like 5 [Chinchilla lanigera]
MRASLHFAASLSLSASQEPNRQDSSSDHGGASDTPGAKPAFCGQSLCVKFVILASQIRVGWGQQRGKLKRSMIPPNLQKKPFVRAPKTKRRAAVPLASPVRLTSCIFPRPVTLITTHPGNKVRYGPREATLEKPQQLCASWRLEAVKNQGTKEERLSRLDFENTYKRLTQGSPGRSQGQSGVESLQPTPGLSPFWKEMIPEALHLLPPSSSQQVTAADIQRQTRRVKKARERLAMALQADRLAREAEASSQEERAENQTEAGAGTAGESQA